MPIRTVEIEGNRIKVDVPDGAPDDFVLRFAYEEYQKATAPDEAPNFDYSVDTGSMEAGLIGAGRTVDKWVQGAGELYDKATGDQKSQERRAAREKMKDDLYAALADDHPVATTLGEIAPFLVGGTAYIPGQVALGAVQSGLMYDENQGENAAVGGVLSAAPGLLGKGYRALKTGANRMRQMPTTETLLNRVAAVSDETGTARRSMSQVADARGFPLSPGERTGNKFLQRVDAALESSPLTSGAWGAHKEKQLKAINRLITESMGETPVDEITETVLDKAATRIGNEFNRLTKGRNMMPDDEFVDAWIAADDELVNGLFDSETVRNALSRLAQRVDDGKPITSGDYQLMSSQITRKLQSASLDGDERQALGAIKEALDGLVERQLSGRSLERFRDARSQWKAYKYAAEMFDGEKVSAVKLGNKLARKDELGMTRGRNKTPLYDAGRLGRAFRPGVGNSGTADRLMMAGLIGVGSYAYGNEGGDAALHGLAGAVVPGLAARAYLKGGSPALANLVNKAPGVAKNILLDPRYQFLLGRSAVGAYATNE